MNSKKLTRRGFMLRFGALASAVSSALVPSSVFAAPAGALSAAKLTGNNKALTFALTLDAPVAHKFSRCQHLTAWLLTSDKRVYRAI